MDQYYAVLGLKPGASESEIKTAYRRLARKYHPDVSKEPDSEEVFIEVTEAYQYLLEKPKQRYSYDQTSTYSPPDREAMRRERARQFAQMRYEEFRRSTIAFQKTWYFKSVKIATFVLIYCLYAAALLMLLAPVIVWIITRSKGLTAAAALFILISSHVFQLARAIHQGTRDYFADWE